MTGLDPDVDEIIEIFCIVTDGDLEPLDDEGWGVVVHQSQERMDKMLASFPEEAIDQARAEAIRFLLSNPIFKTS